MKPTTQPKILLASPTSDAKGYCLREWASCVTDSEFSKTPFDILIVDNSATKSNVKTIEKAFKGKAKVLHYSSKKGESVHVKIANSNEIIRKYAIDNNYDYLFFNESDVFVPQNGLDYLLKKNAQVISLPYFIGQHYQSFLLDYSPTIVGREKELHIKPLLKSFIDFDGKVKRVHLAGLGAMLIKIDVLKQVDFKIDKENGAFSDAHFSEKLQQANIPIYRASKHLCKHKNQNWKEQK